MNTTAITNTTLEVNYKEENVIIIIIICGVVLFIPCLIFCCGNFYNIKKCTHNIINVCCFPFYMCKREIEEIQVLHTVIIDNKLCKKSIDKLNKKNKKSIHDDCIICFDFLNKKKKINLNCKHSFHQECLQTWIENKIISHGIITCPICRKEFITGKKDYYILN